MNGLIQADSKENYPHFTLMYIQGKIFCQVNQQGPVWNRRLSRQPFV